MTLEEYKYLKGLCRAGKLFEIQQWIADGKPIDPPPEGKESMLWVAMETGFVSMVEVLLKAGADPYYHGNALDDAAQSWKTDICELMIRYKVKLKGVDFPWICSHAPFTVFKLLIDYGADLFKGNPIAWALTRNIRPILGIYRRLVEKDARFQKQADMALRHLVEKKNARGVMLMLWAGADPHAKVPVLEFHGGGGDLKSAIYEACYIGDLNLVKRFKPDPERDDLCELLYITMFSRNLELLRYLLSLKPDLNKQPRGHHTPLELILSDIEDANWGRSGGLPTLFNEPQRSEILTLLLENGAKWQPDDHNIHRLRMALYRVHPDRIVEFVKLLQHYEACTPKVLRTLLKQPKMKAHLSIYWPKVWNSVQGR